MPVFLSARLRPRFSVAWGAVLSLGAFLVAGLAGITRVQLFFGLLLAVLAVILGARALRGRLLWRLRNRLLVTYLFIAVIPILLILGMVALTAYLLYGQLAGYLFADGLQRRAGELAEANLALAVELQDVASDEAALRARLVEVHAGLRDEFAGLVLSARGENASVSFPPGDSPGLCDTHPAWAGRRFSGVVMAGRNLFLHSSVRMPGDARTLCLTMPVSQELVGRIGADLGTFSLVLLEQVERRPETGRVFTIDDRFFVPVRTVAPPVQALPPPQHFLDPELGAFSKFNVVQWQPGGYERRELPVLISLATRPSLLNRRLFAPLGEVARALVAILIVIGAVFIVLQLVSLITGVRLTRSMTRSVNELYDATQRLRRGDFAVRLPRRGDDQLGALGDSFNEMAASLQRLIQESRARQRLEQELEIARQVQEQLFPRAAPRLQTLQLIGLCRPARVVSGDYFDYGLVAPGKLLFTIGDVSGKGISAALLMATIQSIVRSHGYASRLTGPEAQLRPAELVARVNRQLCATTSAEKYSTLFVAHYDDSLRRLTYTNAGHMPPFLVGRGRTQKLTQGGPVVGLLREAGYEEVEVELRPGDWLVAFTDGLTEVENAYGEEFGADRLLAFLRRHTDSAAPERLVEALFAEVAEWAVEDEPADDRTVLAARVG